MEKPVNPIDFLEFLAEFGISKERNMSEFISRHFYNAWTKENKITADEDKAVQFLMLLKRKEYVSFDLGRLSNIHNWYKENHPSTHDKPFWFDTYPVMGNITLIGLDYLNQNRLNSSIVTANAISSDNSKTQTDILKGQRKYLYLTTFFTACTLGIAIFTFISDNSKERLRKQLQAQTQQLHTLQIELSRTMNLELQEKEAKKTLPKKN